MTMAGTPSSARIERATVAAYLIPTEEPESDGTLVWDATTLVLVQIEAGGKTGIGYTYANRATAALIHDTLLPLLVTHDAMAISVRWQEMAKAVRNLGRSGICSMALSAVESALWDLKAKLLDLPLAALLGLARPAVDVYGSGGFTSYSLEQLERQLHDWAQSGMQRVKMKIGREPDIDIERVHAARTAIGNMAELFVDANGAYSRKQALEFAQNFADRGVTWFEEPVVADDLAGLRLLRDRAPAGMAIAAGEYGYELPYFRRMLEAQAVDVLQADASRCGGITGFLGVAALCEAFHIPLSTHCAPTLHLPLCCAAPPVVHLEYFHDHARIEHLLFEGAPLPENGRLAPDMSRPGFGIEFKEQDAGCYRI
jgi:L-alanine-DL-glutamate epimerase-like enolase superfamily enzyme